MQKISRIKFLHRTSQLAAGAYFLGLAACQSRLNNPESEEDKKEDGTMKEVPLNT